jgi:opacity protein-like surface antigen
MKCLKWLILAAVAALSSPAPAADLGALAPKAVPYVATFSWTGLLFGGEIGYVSDNLKSDISGVLNGSASSTNGSFVAGGVVNMFYQLPGTSLVVGNELSVDRIFASASTSSQPSWLGKAELALGFTPSANWLLYASGGFAYQALDGSLQIANGALNIDPKGDGWTIGAGVDYAIPGTSFVVGVKYNHTEITGPSLNVASAAFLTTGSTIDQVGARLLLKF